MADQRWLAWQSACLMVGSLMLSHAAASRPERLGRSLSGAILNNLVCRSSTSIHTSWQPGAFRADTAHLHVCNVAPSHMVSHAACMLKCRN